MTYITSREIAYRDAARGTRQQKWLNDLLTEGVADPLAPRYGISKSKAGRFAGSYLQSWNGLIARLESKGATIEQAPLGPQGGQRWIIQRRGGTLT